ncbi:unnamed protein product (mitochondrion) [Plasmodiophora brassicae]|uniref:Uncharacterized protein n=1 Tax=Plasmodiophora brassicae TaxID=37360 RepID=A0A3P3YA13_PLABS|nr:unnamed protein product [Plasmodiophora brassicae]
MTGARTPLVESDGLFWRYGGRSSAGGTAQRRLSSMSHHNLFEDVFEVLEVDPDGKKFDKVSRLYCRSENYDMELRNCNWTTLNLDRSIDDANYYSYAVNDKPTLADKYEYVMGDRCSSSTRLKGIRRSTACRRSRDPDRRLSR